MYLPQDLKNALAQFNKTRLHIDLEALKAIPWDTLGEYSRAARLFYRDLWTVASKAEDSATVCYLEGEMRVAEDSEGYPLRYYTKSRPSLRRLPLDARKLARCFSPPEGKTWLEVSWRGSDSWAIANITKDPGLVECLKAPDPYLWLAEQMGSVPSNSKQTRLKWKQAYFNFLACGKPESLASVFSKNVSRTTQAGYVNPNERDPFGQPMPAHLKNELAYSRVLFEMALVELARIASPESGYHLAYLYMDVMLWEVPSESAEQFEKEVLDVLRFPEATRQMGWVLPPQPEVLQIKSISDWFCH